MRGLTLLGVILLVAGIAGLAMGGFSYTEKDTVLEAGPIKVEADDHHRVNIPTVAGVIIALAGVGLIVTGVRGKA